MNELKRLLKVSVVIATLISAIICVIAYVFFGNHFLQASCLALGLLCAVLNIAILGFSFAPIIFHQQGGLFAFLGFLLSITLLALLSYLVFVMSPNGLLFFGIGIASPALFGAVYGLNFLNREKNEIPTTP